VHVGGQVLEDVRDVSGELLRALGDLVDEVLGLLLGGDLAGEQEPQEGLGERLLAVLGLGQLGLALGDRVAPEANALQKIAIPPRVSLYTRPSTPSKFAHAFRPSRSARNRARSGISFMKENKNGA
jgi:hypothetical protein